MPAVLTVLRFTTGQPERSRWYLGKSEPPQLGRRYSIPLPSVLLGEPAHWALKPTNRVYKTLPLFWGLTGPTKNPMAHCLQYIIQNAFWGNLLTGQTKHQLAPCTKWFFGKPAHWANPRIEYTKRSLCGLGVRPPREPARASSRLKSSIASSSPEMDKRSASGRRLKRPSHQAASTLRRVEPRWVEKRILGVSNLKTDFDVSKPEGYPQRKTHPHPPSFESSPKVQVSRREPKANRRSMWCPYPIQTICFPSQTKDPEWGSVYHSETEKVQ